MANGTILNLGSGGDTVQNIDNTTYKTPVAALTNSTGTTFAAVKGASTAAVATDPALVVTISPNNTVTVAEAPDLTASGSLASATSVTLPTLNDASSVSAQITGTWVGTIIFEGSVDGTNFFAISGNPFTSTGVLISTTTVNGQWQFDVSALQLFRARCSTWTSGTIVVTLRASGTPASVALDSSIPPGSNIIGKIGIDQTTVGTTNAISLSQIGATTIVTGGLAGSQGVGGITAALAASTGNPVSVGGTCLLAAPTKATNGQRVSNAMDSYGRTITTTAADRTLTGTNLTAAGTLTATIVEATVLPAVAATFLDITGIQITNSSATATLVTLRDLSAGITTNIRKIFSIAAGGGIAVTFNPPLAQGAVNNNWTLTCGTAVSSIYCMIDYIKNT